MTLKQGLIVVTAGLVALGLHAQEAAPARASKLEKSLTLGLNLTDGNSETMLANGNLQIAGEKDLLGSFKVGLEGNYGENTTRSVVDGVEIKEDETTVSNAKLTGNAKKTLTPRTYAYLDGSVLNDDIADISYRATLGPGLGLFLVKSDSISLSLDAGVLQLWEDVAGASDDYWALRFSQAFEYKFAANSKIWQSVGYTPEAGDFENYLATAEIGVEAPLQGRLNLRVVLQDKYDSEPGEDVKHNALTLIAGVSIKL